MYFDNNNPLLCSQEDKSPKYLAWLDLSHKLRTFVAIPQPYRPTSTVLMPLVCVWALCEQNANRVWSSTQSPIQQGSKVSSPLLHSVTREEKETMAHPPPSFSPTSLYMGDRAQGTALLRPWWHSEVEVRWGETMWNNVIPLVECLSKRWSLFVRRGNLELTWWLCFFIGEKVFQDSGQIYRQ